MTLTTVKPIAEAILSTGATFAADEKASKAFAQVDSISGKKVRITYIDDVGVQSIEPVGCILTTSERDFVFNSAVLSDYYIFPDVKIPAGGTWLVDGSQFAGLLDPTMRGVAAGTITIRRGADHARGDKQFSGLEIAHGHVTVDSSDAKKRRYGSFTPQGALQYNITDGYVESAQLQGNFQIEELSKDHLLFEATFRTQPKLKVSYSCKIR